MITMSYIVEPKKNKVLSIQYGSARPGSKVVIDAPEGRESQLWKFIYTDMPGVFYIATKENTDLVLTVPENVQAGNPSYAPRLEEIKKDYADSHQLWRLVPSGDGPLSIIQNYDYLNGNGQVLDTNLGNAEGQLVFMYTRCDSDDQKWYFQCQYAT